MLLNDPIAAVIAHGLNKKQGEINVIVYDLSAVSLDVSLLRIMDGDIKIVADSSDLNFGGEHFDRKLTEYFV
jgi:molecular chaperone DnaK (HSP70)